MEQSFFNSKFLIVFFVLLMPSKVVLADQEILLNDGSMIRGEVLSLEHGQYKIRSESMGTVTLSANKIKSISSATTGDSAVTQSNNQSHTQSTAQSTAQSATQSRIQSTVQSMQSNMTNNAGIMSNIMSLQDDPEMQAVLADPEVMQAVQNFDFTALANNPKIKALMNNAKIKNIQGSVK